MMSRFAIGLLVLCVAVNSVPFREELRKKRQSPDDDAVVIVDTEQDFPLRGPGRPFFGNRDVVVEDSDDFPGDTDGSPYFKFGSMPRLHGLLTGLQAQFDSLWNQLYNHTRFISSGMFPPGYHNTTSTTKVVNGSVITVNETIHKSSNNGSTSFFQVKVVDVRPEHPTGNETEGNNELTHPETDINSSTITNETI